MDGPKIQVARQKRTIDDSPPDEVEEFDAIVQNEITVKPSNPMRYTSTHPDRQGTDAESCSVMRREESLALGEGRPSLTRSERQRETFEHQRCILHNGRDHSREDHVADRGFHSRHPHNLVYTPVPISKAVQIRDVQECSGQRVWKKDTNATMIWSKEKCEQDVINESRANHRKVHFATMLDFCHLKHSELADMQKQRET